MEVRALNGVKLDNGALSHKGCSPFIKITNTLCSPQSLVDYDQPSFHAVRSVEIGNGIFHYVMFLFFSLLFFFFFFHYVMSIPFHSFEQIKLIFFTNDTFYFQIDFQRFFFRFLTSWLGMGHMTSLVIFIHYCKLESIPLSRD
jgi:hypothetical protein